MGENKLPTKKKKKTQKNSQFIFLGNMFDNSL